MTNSFDLTGKNAIVTGANTGLGQGISRAFAKAGASIVAVGRSSMEETERLCREAGARFHAIRADLSSLEPIERIVAESADIGRIDILVNNAGIIRRADAISFSEQDWDDVMNVNLKSTFFLSQAVARRRLADERRQDHQHRVAAVLSGRHSHSVLHSEQERGRGPDAASGLRVGGEGNQRERDSAGLFRDQQYRCSPQRSEAKQRDPQPYSCGALGRSLRSRRGRRVPRVHGGRLRPRSRTSRRWRVARTLATEEKMMKRQGQIFAFDRDIAWEPAGPGIRRKILTFDTGVMMVRVAFEAGAVGPPHTHPHIQCSLSKRVLSTLPSRAGQSAL